MCLFQEHHKILTPAPQRGQQASPAKAPDIDVAYRHRERLKMMSSYEDVSPVTSPRNSLYARPETPDIVETQEFTPLSPSGGINLADELAMAEDPEHEDDTGFLAPPQNRNSSSLSDYDGSEYGDIDDDSDGYLSDYIDADQQQLNQLMEDVVEKGGRDGPIGQFVQDLRGMRGQMDVESNTRR
jgi:hypothetical protein